jgi:hypothetical protein
MTADHRARLADEVRAQRVAQGLPAEPTDEQLAIAAAIIANACREVEHVRATG